MPEIKKKIITDGIKDKPCEILIEESRKKTSTILTDKIFEEIEENRRKLDEGEKVIELKMLEEKSDPDKIKEDQEKLYILWFVHEYKKDFVLKNGEVFIDENNFEIIEKTDIVYKVKVDQKDKVKYCVIPRNKEKEYLKKINK